MPPCQTRSKSTAVIIALLVFFGSAYSVETYAQTDFCYAIADGGDTLVKFNQDGTNAEVIGSLAPAETVEGSALRPGTNNLYGSVEAGDGPFTIGSASGGLGVIDLSTGAFTFIGSHGSCTDQNSVSQPVEDIDGMTFDPITGVLYASFRYPDDADNDLLVQIDPATGAAVHDAFGPGISCVVFSGLQSGLGDGQDVDGITIDPNTGIMYGLSSTGSGEPADTDSVVIVDKTNGVVTLLPNQTGFDDVEGMAFSAGGTLFAITGDSEEFIEVDKNTGVGTLVFDLSSGSTPAFAGLGDWETQICPAAPVGSIGDTIWFDTDGDGVADAGESGFGNVTVQLFVDNDGDGNPDDLDGDGNPDPVTTTVTDANGKYLFDDLPPNDYIVVVDESTLPNGGANLVPTTGGPSIPVTLGPGEDNPDIDFGYQAATAVGDFIWADANNDGVQDPGEIGIGGVVVELRDDAGNVIDTTTTAPDGSYLFDGLPADTYEVVVAASNFVAGGPLDGYAVTSGSQSPGAETWGQFPVNAGVPVLDADFGYDNPNLFTISDRVYFDEDYDGTQDATDAPFAGVTVSLLDDMGNVIATTVTDANGDFTFSGVPNGDYTIEITDTSDVLDGLGGTTTPAGFGMLDVTVAGADVSGVNFGYSQLGVVGDTVYSDANSNGTQDPGEPGIAGVTLDLIGAGPDGILGTADDAVIATKTTDAEGKYLFENADGVAAGEDYIVRVTDTNGVLTGFTQTSDPEGDNNGEGTASVGDFLVNGDPAFDLTMDFGYVDPNAGSISGTLFEDTDFDGVDDGAATDPRLPGVTVNLLDDMGNVIATTVTDANGFYEFVGLPPGDYVVEVDPSTLPPTLNRDTLVPSPVTLGPGESSVGNDFGYAQVVTNPVTLRSFKTVAGVNPGDVTFEWSTATETGNLGFDLYYRSVGKGWRKVNGELILSKVVDSVTPQSYEFTAQEIQGSVFAIVDVDIRGERDVHGPFMLGRHYGTQRLERRRTDWDVIRADDAISKARQKARKMQKRQQKLDQKLDREEQNMRQIMKQKRNLSNAAQESDDNYASRREFEEVDKSRRESSMTWWQRGLAAVLTSLVGSAHAMDVANLSIDNTAIYRVTHAQLLAEGVDLAGIKKYRIAMSNQGSEVPIRVGGPLFFGPGSYIEFVGEEYESIYSKTNVYTLRVDNKNIPKIPTNKNPVPAGVPVTTYLETIRIEQDNEYAVSSASDDPWYDQRLVALGSQSASKNFPVHVNNYDASAGAATVSVGVWGWTEFPQNPDHHLVVEVNGVEVSDNQFDGIAPLSIDAPLAAGLISNGTNTITLKLPGDTGTFADMVAVDYYGLTYPRKLVAPGGNIVFKGNSELFEVTRLPDNAMSIYRKSPSGKLERVGKAFKPLTGQTAKARFGGVVDPAGPSTYYLGVVSALVTPTIDALDSPVDITSGQFDYLIISHPNFITSDLTRLANARSAQGYSVKIVNLEDVYAQFSNHIVDPSAISDYITYANQNMGTSHVLLVGGDSYDYFDNLGLGAISFIPSPYMQTDNIVRFAPVDAKFADVDDDNVPDVAIGRMPVRTAGELTTMVDQTLSYDQARYPRAGIFAADQFDTANQYSFKADSNRMINRHFSGWNVTRAYIDDHGVSGARSRIVSAVNNGVALTSFFGHSDLGNWTFEGLFDGDDIAALTNFNLPSVITQWGCWNTYYVSPEEEILGLQFMLNGDRGMAGVLGASTLTQAAAEADLADLVFEELVKPGTTMGEAILLAKQKYAQGNPNQLDVILGWNHLGDPGVVVSR